MHMRWPQAAASIAESIDVYKRQLQNRYRLLSQMEGYCNTTGCLREYMLRYFGDEDVYKRQSPYRAAGR